MKQLGAGGCPEQTPASSSCRCRLRDLLTDPMQLLDQPWVRELPEAKNFELASATMMYAHKPGGERLAPSDPP